MYAVFEKIKLQTHQYEVFIVCHHDRNELEEWMFAEADKIEKQFGEKPYYFIKFLKKLDMN